MELVRGTGQPLTIFNSFGFKDLYDNGFSFWIGIFIYFFCQFWSFGLPIAMTLYFILSGYDTFKLFESIWYLVNVTEENPYSEELTLVNLFVYPVRRLLVN